MRRLLPFLFCAVDLLLVMLGFVVGPGALYQDPTPEKSLLEKDRASASPSWPLLNFYFGWTVLDYYVLVHLTFLPEKPAHARHYTRIHVPTLVRSHAPSKSMQELRKDPCHLGGWESVTPRDFRIAPVSSVASVEAMRRILWSAPIRCPKNTKNSCILSARRMRM